MLAPTVAALREALGADAVRTDAGAAVYRVGDAEPVAAVLPRDETDVARTLALAWEAGLGVVPWGGGAHQCVGRRPTRYDLALDLRRLDHIVAYEPADMTATVQAGVNLAKLQRRLGEAGQFWPLDPPLADRATVGGIVAANLSGPLRCRYGTVRDLVLGARVAHADGTITKAGSRVVKNATAYDLTKLYAGSFGTLGVLLETTLRLQPRPAVERTWCVAGAALAACHNLGMRVLGSHLMPSRLELLDAGGATACGVVQSGPSLVVSFAGVGDAVRDQGATLEAWAGDCGLLAQQVTEPGQRWEAIRDFPWKMGAQREAACRAIWRGSVLPSECAKAMEAVRDAVAGCEDVAVAATVSHGVLRGEMSAQDPAVTARGLSSAREALGVLGGFLVVLDAPAPVRATVDEWGPMLAEAALMRQIRVAFDAKGVVNPGRFAGER
jgi:glycolate oxidase FAD binding subunit